MLIRLLLLFTLVPLAEFFILLKIADIRSAEFAFGLVLATGIIGASLARWQGLSWRRQLNADMSAGRLPAASLLDGLLIFIAGTLLITPGVLTDILGFLLLTPFFRALCRKWIKSRFMRGFKATTTDWSDMSGDSGAASRDNGRDVIIDSYVIERKSDPPPGDSSGANE